MSDDQAFLTRLRQHDEAAFTEFFETNADRVYRLAIGLLTNCTIEVERIELPAEVGTPESM